MRSLHFRHYLSYLVHLAMNFPPLHHMISHRLFFHIPEKQHHLKNSSNVEMYLQGFCTFQTNIHPNDEPHFHTYENLADVH